MDIVLNVLTKTEQINKLGGNLKLIHMFVTLIMVTQVYAYAQTHQKGFPCGSAGKESACNVGDWVRSLSWEDPLEEEMATHSSILARRIPGTIP